MRVFTKKQIDNFEKARLDVLEKIELFEMGIRFTKETYIVKAHFFDLHQFNTEWLDRVKKAINDVDLAHDKLAGINVQRSNKVTATLEYLSKIHYPVYKEFKAYNTQIIDKILEKFETDVIAILLFSR